MYPASLILSVQYVSASTQAPRFLHIVSRALNARASALVLWDRPISPAIRAQCVLKGKDRKRCVRTWFWFPVLSSCWPAPLSLQPDRFPHPPTRLCCTSANLNSPLVRPPRHCSMQRIRHPPTPQHLSSHCPALSSEPSALLPVCIAGAAPCGATLRHRGISASLLH
jgi:hypothetical protein